jgi:hypothetical protein
LEKESFDLEEGGGMGGDRGWAGAATHEQTERSKGGRHCATGALSAWFKPSTSAIRSAANCLCCSTAERNDPSLELPSASRLLPFLSGGVLPAPALETILDCGMIGGKRLLSSRAIARERPSILGREGGYPVPRFAVCFGAHDQGTIVLLQNVRPHHSSTCPFWSQP